ncbi:MAG TPA: AAA family ATPase [Bacillota bacterium]
MGRVIAVANQKGGVGKTTTAVNLAAAIAATGRRTLLIDIDPQGHSTTGLGLGLKSGDDTVYDVLVDEVPLERALHRTAIPHLQVVPAGIDLAGAEIELVSVLSREQRLRRALAPVRDRYGYVLVDCPPSLGLLTVNALTAADSVLVPIQCEYYALEGLGQLMNTIRLIQTHLNPALQLEGVVLTMFDARTNLSLQVVEEVKRYFRDKVLSPIVPRNVRLSEAPSYGKPITQYDPRSRGAEVYRELALEVIRRVEGEEAAG